MKSQRKPMVNSNWSVSGIRATERDLQNNPLDNAMRQCLFSVNSKPDPAQGRVYRHSGVSWLLYMNEWGLSHVEKTLVVSLIKILLS